MYGEFAEGHLSVHNLLEGLDGGIDRSVAAGTCLEVFAGYVETEACHGLHAHAAGHLQVFHLDAVVGGAIHSGQYEDVVVVDVFLLVGQAQEVFIHLVELLFLEFHAEHCQAVFQRGTSAACCQHYRVVVDSHVVRVDDFVGLHVFQHSILMYA